MGKQDMKGEIDDMIKALKGDDAQDDDRIVDDTGIPDDTDDTDEGGAVDDYDEDEGVEDDEEDNDEDEDEDDAGQPGQSEIIDLMRSVINDMVSMTKTKVDDTAGKKTDDEVPDITDEEIEVAMQSPDNFKKILAKQEQRVMKRIFSEVLPGMYESIVQQVQIQNAVNDFYNSNPDLKPYKELVAYITKAVAEEHPDWPVDKVLASSAKIARQKLLLTNNNKTNKKGKYKAKPPASKKPSPKLSDMEKEILDLIS